MELTAISEAMEALKTGVAPNYKARVCVGCQLRETTRGSEREARQPGGDVAPHSGYTRHHRARSCTNIVIIGMQRHAMGEPTRVRADPAELLGVARGRSVSVIKKCRPWGRLRWHATATPWDLGPSAWTIREGLMCGVDPPRARCKANKKLVGLQESRAGRSGHWAYVEDAARPASFLQLRSRGRGQAAERHAADRAGELLRGAGERLQSMSLIAMALKATVVMLGPRKSRAGRRERTPIGGAWGGPALGSVEGRPGVFGI